MLDPTVPDGLVSEAIQWFLPRASNDAMLERGGGREGDDPAPRQRPRHWGLEESDMTEQDLNHGPCEGLAPLYPDQVYDWGNPRMREVTAARVEARANDWPSQSIREPIR